MPIIPDDPELLGSAMARLDAERLEDRLAPAVFPALAAGTLSVQADDDDARIQVVRDGSDLLVLDTGVEIARVAASAVSHLNISTGAGNDVIEVAPDVTVPTDITAGGGLNLIRTGGGPITVSPGAGIDKVVPAVVVAPPSPAPVTTPQVLSSAEVELILDRAVAATASRDAIMVVVDRNGRILGVRVEDLVSPAITGDPGRLVFSVDGALAKARTGAFFGNDQAPLTSRTIQNLSQSTITEREVNSNPNITEPNSPSRGPGYVAAVGVGGHFPPGIANTPPVDLFGIEHTNRDGTQHPGADHIKGTADDVTLPSRFNIDPAFVPPGQELFPPDSYGVTSGLMPGAQGRGIATLPGGIPIVKNGQVVGGIGVFFPGQTGFATEENNVQSTTYDPNKPDRTLEAEFIAFAAIGGSSGAGFRFAGPIGDAPAINPAFDLPGDPRIARIDLVGITLDVFGPGGIEGPDNLVRYGLTLGVGSRTQGSALPVSGSVLYLDGLPVPEGWLVTPHDGVGITAAEVTDIIVRGYQQAAHTRAAIRTIGSFARMVFAVTDLEGNVVGLYRMPDATVFSIDVAVAKARNVRYYADPGLLQPVDATPFVPPGVAFTNRTFRYLAQPRFPEGFDGTTPAPYSILLDGNADLLTGRLNGAPLPASAFDSVYGYDSFNPGTNFRDPTNVLNQNGIVFFPGSAPLYRSNGLGGGTLIAGFGVSGDGVDQDDVVTFGGSTNFGVPDLLLRADEVFVAGVRLPYQKFNRNPEGGIPG